MLRQSVSFIFFCLLLAVATAKRTQIKFNYDKCTACVAKGCGYCHREAKQTTYNAGECVCNTHLFNYGPVCNDLSMITNGNSYGNNKYGYNYANYEEEQQNDDENANANKYWTPGGFDYKKAHSRFGCHLHGHPTTTMSLLSVFGGLGAFAIVGFIMYQCLVHCPKGGIQYGRRSRKERKERLMQDEEPTPVLCGAAIL